MNYITKFWYILKAEEKFQQKNIVKKNIIPSWSQWSGSKPIVSGGYTSNGCQVNQVGKRQGYGSKIKCLK